MKCLGVGESIRASGGTCTGARGSVCVGTRHVVRAHLRWARRNVCVYALGALYIRAMYGFRSRSDRQFPCGLFIDTVCVHARYGFAYARRGDARARGH